MYSGNLFAQDEIMTLEHPILCSLREGLLYNQKKDFESPLTPSCANGSVVITNVVHHGRFSQYNLSKIYGNKFSKYGTRSIVKMVKKYKSIKISNIICIASLCHMNCKYTKQHYNELFSILYSGFKGSRNEVFWNELNKQKNIKQINNNKNKLSNVNNNNVDDIVDDNPDDILYDIKSDDNNEDNNEDNNNNNNNNRKTPKVIIHTGV